MIKQNYSDNLKISNVRAFLVDEHPELLIAISVITAGIGVTIALRTIDPNFLLYYGDGVSHLVIARRVFDSLTPALAQLGGVWLPMTHLMLMPFVSNDFLFQTGVAGMAVSLSATAITAVAIFRIVKLQFASSLIGMLSSLFYFLNPSVIYMGIVPMMEALFMMFFMLSVYYVQKWYQLYMTDGDVWLQYRMILKCALAVSAACLTRYEGYILPLGLILVIVFVYLFVKRRNRRLFKKQNSRHRLEAILSVAIIFGFIGIGSWIAWNLVIFRDPSYSFTGPYSAGVQADSRGFNQEFKLNPALSLSVIFEVARQMYGLPVLITSIIGISIYLYVGARQKSLFFHLLTIIILMTPILADFAAMIQGSGEIYPTGGESWFNGRYLMFIAPLLAFGAGSMVAFIRRKKKESLTILVVVLIAASYIYTFASQSFAIGEAVALNDLALLPLNSGAQVAFETGVNLNRLYQQGNIVAFLRSSDGHSIMLSSHLPLKNFIDVANGQYWDISKQSPWIYGDYVITEKKVNATTSIGFEGDPSEDVIDYWHANRSTLMKHYDMIYENERFEILKRKYADQTPS
jgi:hypothetical protein